MYGNRMTGTEVDETSVTTAAEQVENNKLEHLIKVVKVSGETILKDVVGEQDAYHFSMCNPPFFETEDTPEKTIKRLPPRNAPTGNEGELTIEGGERKFVTDLIEESVDLKEKIKIYTTMIGRKSNLFYLVKSLKKRNIDNLTWTEFCQGHTKRWGLAWTFLPKDKVDLTNAPVIRKTGDFLSKLLNDRRPIEIIFPMGDQFSSFDYAVNFLQETMNELNIKMKDIDLPVDDFDGWACQLTAETDTWSHARRKRRMAQRKLHQNSEAQVLENTEPKDTEKDPETGETKDDSKSTSNQESQSLARNTAAKDPLLECNFFLELIEDSEAPERNNFKIWMTLEKGSGGRNALETFRQYLINRLGARDYFLKQCGRASKRKRKRLKRSASDSCESTDRKPAKSQDSSIESDAESS